MNSPRQSTKTTSIAVIVFWVIIALLILIGASWHAAQIQWDRQAVHDWQQKRDAEHKRVEHLERVLSKLQGGSLRSVQTFLNRGQTFNTSQGRSLIVWEDPQSSSTSRLRFTEDRSGELRLETYSIQLAPRRTLHPPKRKESYYFGEQIRSAVAGQHTEIGWGPTLWVVILIATTLLPRIRWLLKHLLLATALVCLIAWLIHPGHWPTIRGVLTNDMLVLGIVMVSASVACFAVMSKNQSPPDRQRLGRRISLRQVFAATACLAFAQVSGPLGIALIIVAAICIVEFRFVQRFVASTEFKAELTPTTSL